MRSIVTPLCLSLSVVLSCSGDIVTPPGDDAQSLTGGSPSASNTGPSPAVTGQTPIGVAPGGSVNPQPEFTPTPIPGQDVQPTPTDPAQVSPTPVPPGPTATPGTELTPTPTPIPPTPIPPTPTPTVNQCTDTPPDDRQTCATWAEWGECDNPNGWLDAFCDASCGRCMSTPGNTPVPPGPTPTPGQPGPNPTPTPQDNTNPYPPIQGGMQGHATRYWDCCKPHCAWESNTPGGVQPLVSCGQSNNNLGATEAANACFSQGNTAYMCYSMHPWAANSVVAYGFAAVAFSGDICGKCYQVEFTGEGHYDAQDPGSRALRDARKVMIVQATNIGSVGEQQLDILIPGGGVGDFDACTSQWNESNLGGRFGGFLDECKRRDNYQGTLASYKQCVREHCNRVFSRSGFEELLEGCRWFVDWFEIADNPKIVYQEVACPEELRSLGIRR